MINKLKFLAIKSFSWVLSKIIPTNSKTIYFESFQGQQFSDNPRAIFEYISKEYPDFNCYWGVSSESENVFEGMGLQTIEKLSLKWFVVLAKSKYWVVNTAVHGWLVKPNKTILLQTWHGTPLKKIGLDMSNEQIPEAWNKPIPYKQHISNEGARWDYLVSPNSYSSEIFKRCFDFRGELLETGYPRNDYLTYGNKVENIKSIKEKIGIPPDKKVILYAPTWRDSTEFSLELDLKELKKEFGNEYMVLLRLHYSVKSVKGASIDGNFVKNVSDYGDIRDLYLIADLLVTDYSSVFFDYSLLNRPIIFYCYDLERYKDNMRGFYFNFKEEAPGPIVTTHAELVDAIKRSANQASQPEFIEEFTSLEDGYATKRVVERMLNKKNQ